LKLLRLANTVSRVSISQPEAIILNKIEKDLSLSSIEFHETLNGMTPAEASGINLELGKNKWLDLIKQSERIKL